MPAKPSADYRNVAWWDQLIQRDPAGLVERADEVLGSVGPDDTTARALAHWAIGRARLDLGQLTSAAGSARAALAMLGELGDDEVRQTVVLSTAVILAEAGDVEGGLEALDSLRPDDRLLRARVELQRSYILHHAGRLVDALLHLDHGERLLAELPEARDLYRLHNHRGVVLLQQGRFSEAEADLLIAERLAGDHGFEAARALSIANRAVLYGRSRRLALSLRTFDEAMAVFAGVGNPARMVALAEIDRAEVTMYSGLAVDAVVAARRAIELVEPTGNRVLLGDAHLVLARALLAAGDRAAGPAAETAGEVFRVTGRPDMVSHATALAMHARLRRPAHAVEPDAAVAALDDARHAVDALRRQGWDQLGDELALDRVRLAARIRRLDLVGEDVDRLMAGASSERRDVALAGMLVEAYVQHATGDLVTATSTVKRGLDRLDSIVGEASSLAERSAALRLGADLSSLLITIAVEAGNAGMVLAAAEGTRARALHDELAERDQHRPLTEAGAARLESELISRLGDRTLVEWIVTGSRVMAVVLDREGARLVDVADLAAATRTIDRLLVQLDVATSDPDGSSARAVRAAQLLDDLLLEPLGLHDGDGVVMVPVDLLHGVPWSGLPTLATRAFVLAPSAQLWLEGDRRAASSMRSVGLVVGPAISGGDVERSAITTHHPGAAIAAHDGASGATLASMLGSADLVHVAAHGRFRSDRPLLSTLRLAEGEVTLIDAMPHRVGAALVVLSSCEGGAQGTADGSEVLGLCAVLLARGAASVLAPLTAVRELECAEFVAEVHAELAQGEPLSAAVVAVRRRWLDDDDLSRWAVASSFSCFGSGAARVQR